MAADGAQYLLPEGLGIAEASAAVGAHLAVERGAASAAERMFYDTFDGRLHAAGLVVVHADGRLALADGTTYAEHAGADYAAAPERVLALDLPAGPLRAALEPIVEMRALTPIARVRSRRRALRVLDDERQDRRAARARGAGARRRRAAAARAAPVARARGPACAATTRRSSACGATLERELGFAAARRGAATTRRSRPPAARPGGVSSKLDVALQPDQRADSAAAVAARPRCSAAIEANLPGTLADVDSEFLHDLRVAVRRTRSAAAPARGACSRREPLAHFRAEFRWLQQVTGPTRDLDVYLLEFDELARAARRAAADLEPLRGLLRERRRRERSAAWCARCAPPAPSALLADWPVFLDGLVDAPQDDRPGGRAADRRARGRADRRASTGRWSKAGAAIDDASPPEALHDLRKTGQGAPLPARVLRRRSIPAEVVKPMVQDAQGAAGHARPLPGPRGAGRRCCARCGDEVAARRRRRRGADGDGPARRAARGATRRPRAPSSPSASRRSPPSRSARSCEETFAMSRVLATYNIKGGVGKTSAAVNLAYLAARDGAPHAALGPRPAGRRARTCSASSRR